MTERPRLRGTSREIVETARDLRVRQTPAEERLWQALRNRQAIGHRARRQHPFGPYVIDFWIPAVRVAIEIDGSIHERPDIAAQDGEREAWLRAHDIELLRFRNEEVLNYLDDVLARIGKCVKLRETHLEQRGSFRQE